MRANPPPPPPPPLASNPDPCRTNGGNPSPRPEPRARGSNVDRIAAAFLGGSADTFDGLGRGSAVAAGDAGCFLGDRRGGGDIGDVGGRCGADATAGPRAVVVFTGVASILSSSSSSSSSSLLSAGAGSRDASAVGFLRLASRSGAAGAGGFCGRDLGELRTAGATVLSPRPAEDGLLFSFSIAAFRRWYSLYISPTSGVVSSLVGGRARDFVNACSQVLIFALTATSLAARPPPPGPPPPPSDVDVPPPPRSTPRGGAGLGECSIASRASKNGSGVPTFRKTALGRETWAPPPRLK
jgi:hypothetical protein|eukprot:31398-Pelagococcus_subviridis.AAC.13